MNARSYTTGWDYRARPWVPMGHGRPINPGPRGGVSRQNRRCPELRTWAARQRSSLPPPTEVVGPEPGSVDGDSWLREPGMSTASPWSAGSSRRGQVSIAARGRPVAVVSPQRPSNWDVRDPPASTRSSTGLSLRGRMMRALRGRGSGRGVPPSRNEEPHVGRILRPAAGGWVSRRTRDVRPRLMGVSQRLLRGQINILSSSRGTRIFNLSPTPVRGPSRWLIAGGVLASCRQSIVMLPPLHSVGRMMTSHHVTAMASVCKVCIPLKDLHLCIFVTGNLWLIWRFSFPVLDDSSGCFIAHAVSLPSAASKYL